jgi:hypothetical protein
MDWHNLDITQHFYLNTGRKDWFDVLPTNNSDSIHPYPVVLFSGLLKIWSGLIIKTEVLTDKSRIYSQILELKF